MRPRNVLGVSVMGLFSLLLLLTISVVGEEWLSHDYETS